MLSRRRLSAADSDSPSPIVEETNPITATYDRNQISDRLN